MADDQTDIVAFLSRPQAYGLESGTIERCATHGSFVFLAGERAYKLKRAVRFPYMDYSTLKRRKAMCEAELAVNRRLAPELYIGTAPIVRRKDGSLHIGGADETHDAIDWLVVMRRFGQDALFDAMQRRGALTLPLMRQLAERIAAFHLGADKQPAFGGARGIAAVIEENIDLLGKMAGHPFERARIDRLAALAGQALERARSLLDARRDDGHVRRCHGDLHLGNICLFDGRPVPFDAIEFREEFTAIDVLYDLAFLLMDLDRRGLRAHANAVLNRYLEKTGDYAGLGALPLFLSCRAAVRAHVTIAAAAFDKDGVSRAREAQELLDRAILYLEPRAAQLVAVGGISGTGKSTLAACLAPAMGRIPGAIVIRSDVMRKLLWGVDALQRLPPAAYEAQFTRRVYAMVAQQAGLVLDGGYCAVGDAVFGNAEQRAEIETIARERAVPFRGLWLHAPVPVLERRVAARQNDASDATLEVLRAQLAGVESPKDWTCIDAGGAPADSFAQAASALALTDS